MIHNPSGPYIPYQVNLTAFICSLPVSLTSRTVFTQEGGMKSFQPIHLYLKSVDAIPCYNIWVRCMFLSPVPLIAPSTIVIRTSGTTASLQWAPLSLEDSRGFVVSYSVKYSQRSDITCSPPSTWTDATDVTTHNVSYIINGLLPHLSYCVVVSANTVAGTGVYGALLEIPCELLFNQYS